MAPRPSVTRGKGGGGGGGGGSKRRLAFQTNLKLVLSCVVNLSTA